MRDATCGMRDAGCGIWRFKWEVVPTRATVSNVRPPPPATESQLLATGYSWLLAPDWLPTTGHQLLEANSPSL